MTNPDRLEIKKPLLVLLSFIALIGILLLGLTQIDKSRKSQVYERYATETNLFIEKNHAGLVKLFTELFPNSICNVNAYDDAKTSCNEPSANDLANLTSQELKDWSSTAFLKKANGDILMMRLNGETYKFRTHYYDEDKKLKSIEGLLSGVNKEILWDDYTYDFSNKEVIIPVKDSHGNIMGAIIRGVIE